jgi:hypothetical protein
MNLSDAPNDRLFEQTLFSSEESKLASPKPDNYLHLIGFTLKNFN